MIADGSSVGAPCTCERNPSSAYFSARVMPDFASWRLDSTSWVLLPMDETMPIPVTTTRLMISSPAFSARTPTGAPSVKWLSRAALSGPGRLRPILDQRDFQVVGAIAVPAIVLEPPVRDAEHELGTHHAPDVDAVNDFLDVRQHLAGELDLADAERAAAAGRAGPAEEESHHLPQRVQPEAAGHHRIAFEVTGEKPQIRLHAEHRAHQPLAIFAARLRDFGDPIEHQHR